ncbi:MAG: SDR family oxidoreductase [Actinobacteria bacterium]|nr:SDR family oxidoreductase [Actinomycetota bacterium]
MQIAAGTRALVTGASRGIGLAVARGLAQRGATVGLAARSAADLEALAAELPGTHYPLICDVALPASIATAVETFVAAAGRLDLLVANAGIAHYEPVAEQSLQKIEHMTAVNWLGTVHTVQAALPFMLEQGSGHVVVMSSGVALRGFPGAAAYSATKAAQRMFAEALRHELAGSGVSVTTVYPGEIRTSLHDHQRARMPAWYRGGPAAASPDALAQRIIRAVERDSRHLHYRRLVRGMGILNGLSPSIADRVLRRLRGPAAAPRRD